MKLLVASGIMGLSILAGKAAAAAAGETPATTQEAANSRETIHREAGRQDKVSGEIIDLIRDLRHFADDIESNKIFDELKGSSLLETMGSLGTTDEKHVRTAARELREAVHNAPARREHITQADTEIKHALERLAALMQMAGAVQAQEQLSVELEQIIRRQQELTDKSVKVGREMAEEAATTSFQPEELAAEQEKIASRAANLRPLIRQAFEDERTNQGRQKLNRAAAVMEQRPADGLMRLAGENIRDNDMIAAVGEQKEAMAALRELAEILSEQENNNLAAMSESLEKLLQQQTNLREQTEAMPNAELPSKASELQKNQQALMDRLAELAQNMPLPKAPPSFNTKAMGPDPTESGPPPEGGAPKGGAGKKGGGSNTGAGQGAQNAPPRDRPPMSGGAPGQKPMSAAGQAMQNAENALGQQDQSAAAAAQRAAEQALAEALAQMSEAMAGQPSSGMADASQGEGTPSEGQPGAGKPGEGQGKSGEGKSGQGQSGQGKGGKGGLGGRMPGQGSSGIASKNVYGKLPDDNQSRWNSLDDQDRAGLSENFARELPREYRDMLKAYYERLAK